MSKKKSRTRSASSEFRVGALSMVPVTPIGAKWTPQKIEDLRLRLGRYPLEEVLVACANESALINAGDDTSRIIASGPLRGSYITFPGLAYVARQAFVVCSPSNITPKSARGAVSDAVQHTAVAAYHLASVYQQDEWEQNKDYATSVVLRYAALHSRASTESNLIARYLGLFAMPVQDFGGSQTLGEEFEKVCSIPYAHYVTIGFILMTLINAYRSLALQDLAFLWTESPWSDWCSQDEVEKVIDILAQTPASHKQLAESVFIRGEASPEELFAFNPLIKYPLVRCNDGRLVAPIPRYILYRLTDGAIRVLSDEMSLPGAEHNAAMAAVGHAVEAYVGELLHRRYPGDVFPEVQYKQGSKGPDFTIVRDKDLLLLEVKKTQPTIVLQERGDPGEFQRLVASYIASPLRKLPAKELLLFKEDQRIQQRLPHGARRINHAVVTLNSFSAQSLWWESQVIPVLRDPKGGDLEGAPYDPAHAHHLLSLAEIEDATSDRVPHIVKLLQKAWVHGRGYELFEELQRYKDREPRHAFRDGILKQWHESLLYPVQILERFADGPDPIRNAIMARKAWRRPAKKNDLK